MIIVYQGEKETYPKNLVVEYDLIKNKCKDENTYLNHLQELARDHSWNNLLDCKKFAYNNEKDNYPYPTILSVF